MPHFGILCPTATGHFNPMAAVGRALQRRGHRVTLFQIPEAEPKAAAAGLGFVAIGASEYPPGVMGAQLERLSRMRGLAAFRWTVEIFRRFAAMSFRETPHAMRTAGVDALLVDQASLEGRNVADVLGLPFVSVANALPLNHEPGVPPYTTGWAYHDARWARLRNRAAYFAQGRIIDPLIRTLQAQREAVRLPPVPDRMHWYSSLAQVAQLPAELDFPRTELPRCFHYAGPFVDPEARAPVAFPYEALDGRPLIYASMGTIQNGQLSLFDRIARACQGLDAQLVISLGGLAAPEALPHLPGSPLVVGYAPQLELVRRARLVITHAGQNTALETLAQAVPMVAIPIANDQPGVAARLARAGAAEVVPLARLDADRLRGAVERVLGDPSYAEAAARLQAAIRRTGGAPRAAEIIERAVTTRNPVTADRPGPKSGPHRSPSKGTRRGRLSV